MHPVSQYLPIAFHLQPADSGVFPDTGIIFI